MAEYKSKYCMRPSSRDCLMPGVDTSGGKVELLICKYYAGNLKLPKDEKNCTFPEFRKNGLTDDQHYQMCIDRRGDR